MANRVIHVISQRNSTQSSETHAQSADSIVVCTAQEPRSAEIGPRLWDETFMRLRDGATEIEETDSRPTFPALKIPSGYAAAFGLCGFSSAVSLPYLTLPYLTKALVKCESIGSAVL